MTILFPRGRLETVAPAVAEAADSEGAVIMTNGMRSLELAVQILSSIAREYQPDEDRPLPGR